MAKKIAENKKDKLLHKSKSPINAYLKYSGMGIQMALIIVFFSFLGVQLDKYFEIKHLFTVIFSLFGVALSMYVFIKKILTENSKDKEEDTNI